MAGESPGQLRRATSLASGLVARPAPRHGNRVLGRLARHHQHTLDVIRLHQHARAALDAARQAGQPVTLFAWHGPVARPIRFPTTQPT